MWWPPPGLAALDSAWINGGAAVLVALVGGFFHYAVKARAASLAEEKAYRRELLEDNRELRHEVNRLRKENVALRRKLRTERRHGGTRDTR